jgi:alpha-beta hydrolase superfamily lysophospholipase
VSRRTTVIAALLGCLAVVATITGCSSGGGSASSDTSAITTATIAAPAGLPDFYSVPDPLPAGQPGDLIKAEPVPVTGLSGSVWRVMYLSESVAGDPIAVTGLIAVPSAPAPDGGRPVISWAHGTTGIADACAPSLDASALTPVANLLLQQGYVVTATDYEGQGTPGRHPYIAGVSEGRGVLDIVKTARQMPETDAGPRYVIWGHSQGGHAALFAGHLAAEWAPDLQLLGVVAGAPPSQLLLINAALQQSPFKYYIGMAAAGLNAAYGDEKAPLDQVLTPAGLTWLDQVDTKCASDLGIASRNIDFTTLQKADPASVPVWNQLLSANDPGTFTAPIPAPLLIIHGGNDEQIPTASSGLLFAQLCAVGQVEQRWVYPDQSHAGVIAPSLNDMLTWIDHRFAGEPAPDPMQPQGPPVPTTQSCPSS